ncbi:MAG: low-specificity L-threonine aldolase [Bacteroidetes bacterium]|nr:MAG: low-specificity L-threonine aldolase [Bacteroidota bacterium]
MTIDFRSDTLTQPTPAMREAMAQAPVGDDVYGEDPTVNALEEEVATLFGKEAAVFCPSGTMCNQIAIRISTQPQDEVICDRQAHVYLYEGGGIAANSLASVRLLEGDRGRLTAAQVAAAINPDDVHFPVSRLVCLENTANKGGGSCYDIAQIAAIHALCRERGLRLHLDGARLFNAIVATGTDPSEFGALFDTLSVCLSKGLGAPVGSLLLGSRADIKQARRVRKLFGGGMRQAGILAAAGRYALAHHVDRLAEDHARARALGDALAKASWVGELLPVETNIVVFRPDPGQVSSEKLVAYLAEQGIRVSTFGPGYLRMVTHLDIDDLMLERAVEVLRRASFPGKE